MPILQKRHLGGSVAGNERRHCELSDEIAPGGRIVPPAGDGRLPEHDLMERVIYGWQTSGVCDRLTAMLLAATIARQTQRKALWHWVVNGDCNCGFERLFQTDALQVSNSTYGLDGFTLDGRMGTAIIQMAKARSE